MKRDFKTYLLRTKRTHYYRLKSIMPIGDFGSTEDEKAEAMTRLERIERCVARYEPISFEKVKRTMIQHLPLDFPNVQNREVYILDMVFAVPCSPEALLQLVHAATRIPVFYLAVHGEADPREIEMQKADALAEIAAEAADKGLVPAALLSDPDYMEAPDTPDDLFGNEANSRFLSYLASIRTDKPVVPDDVSVVDYNADIKDAPKVDPGKIETVDNQIETVVRRTFRDKDGKLHTLTREIPTLSKED